MNILILNWRDIKNPQSGGAEVLTHEMAKRWVTSGHTVTQISERFGSSLENEIIDGVKFFRKGTWWSVHLYAWIWYIFRFSKHVDIIIDELHWFPFFSVLYAHKKVILLVCEVANPLLFKLFPYPIATVIRIMEKISLSWYRNVPILSISQSTKQDLIREGFTEKTISVLPLGITIPSLKKLPSKKADVPTIIYIGRLHKLKGIEDAIEVFSLIHKVHQEWNFWIVGSGDAQYTEDLIQMVYRAGVKDVTKFYGYVTEVQKFSLLARAHILIAPSYHEGWGLMVTEAAYMGTPAVGYRKGALVDSIQNDRTGVITRNNTPCELAQEIMGLLKDKNRYIRYQREGQRIARYMSWDATATESLRIMKAHYEK